jgi:hypothetical protein
MNDLRLFDYNYDQTHIKYSEGYWSLGFTGATQANDSKYYTTRLVHVVKLNLYGHSGTAKQFAKSPYNLTWSLVSVLGFI